VQFVKKATPQDRVKEKDLADQGNIMPVTNLIVMVLLGMMVSRTELRIKALFERKSLQFLKCNECVVSMIVRLCHFAARSITWNLTDEEG